MKKTRFIPYGYTMRNGRTVIEHGEADIIRYIFDEYIKGASLKDLAEELTARKVPYTEKTEVWDKARIARIIDNAKYTGSEIYDPMLGHKYVIVQDKRREPAGFPNEISEFVQWLIDGVKECIEMLMAGTYNDFIKDNLPPEHRTGKILRKHYWDVWPEARKEFFEDISAEDVAEFIRKASAQGEGSDTIMERLPSMTANDFFRFCAMGYAENKYNGCDKTPKEQYYLHADGRDEGLKDLDPDDPEAFHAWLHDYSRGGGHPWEVCRGGNSTHVSLRPLDDKRGYFLYLDGDAWNRTIETVKFYLALTRAGIPVYLIEAHTLADRLAEKEWIGIVPDGVMPAYCESWFPNEHIIDYMNLPYDDREKFLPFCVWYDEEPIMLVTEKEAEPK